MKSIINSFKHWANLFKVLAIIYAVFFCSISLGQPGIAKFEESRMPDQFQIVYDVTIKILTSETEQRKEYEAALADAREITKNNKNIIVGVPDRFPGPIPERR